MASSAPCERAEMNAEQAVEYEEGYKGGGTAYGLSVRSGNIQNITAHREDLERLGSAYRAELIDAAEER